ncbi:MAG: anti-sigma factor family protein, partial [Gemmatimonadales bacterium]
MNLHTQDHIDDSDLLRFVDRELGELDVEIVEGHIAQCSDCRDRYDDLAAASDSLTAFLNQADYAPRALAYTPARAAGWWNKPLLRAAAVTLLLAGVATPAAILLMDHGAASNEPKGMLVLPPSRAPGEPGATSRS